MENNAQKTFSTKRSSPFWFMNKIANPFVHLILNSSLHGWLSGSIILITYQGRKSGKMYTVPVQYVQSDNILYIIPGAAGQKTWWRNLRGGAPVEVLMAGNNLRADAEVLSAEAHSAVIEGSAQDLFTEISDRHPSSFHLRPSG